MSLEVDYISDTHLNLWKYNESQIAPIFSGLSPTLILAGDIGDPDELTLYRTLEHVRKRYEHVIYIPGNHEFYVREPGSKKTPHSVLSWFQKLDTQWDNFHLFYRRSEIYNGIRIIGATAWSTSPRDTNWSRKISEEGRLDALYLNEEIAKAKQPCLLVTHYPPTLSVLQDNFRNKITEYDYANNLEYMFRPPIHTWIFGHVHQCHNRGFPYSSSLLGSGSIQLLSNPYGYPHEGITSPVTKTTIISKKV